MANKYSTQDQVEALNRHDADAFAGFYAPNAVVWDPQHPEPLRGGAIRKDIADFVKAFPDLKFTPQDRFGKRQRYRIRRDSQGHS